jgi:hypothetical protein
VSAALPKLIDSAGIQRELGIKRAAAEGIMRHLDKVQVPGVRRVFVKRADVQKLLDESTVAA